MVDVFELSLPNIKYPYHLVVAKTMYLGAPFAQEDMPELTQENLEEERLSLIYIVWKGCIAVDKKDMAQLPATSSRRKVQVPFTREGPGVL